MPSLVSIKKMWSIPDGWTVHVDDKLLEVVDNDGDPVATAITQIHAIESIQQHLEEQEGFVAYKMMLASLKNPIEG